MDTKLFGRFAAACLAVATIPIAIIVCSPKNASHAADRSAQATDTFSPYVGKDGSIARPTDYRETFRHLGTWAVAKEANAPVHEMHNVYAQLDAIKSFEKNGTFPDGAVLVKEITNVRADKLTTGQSTWSTDDKVWFVMIKDSKGRFPDNPLWGKGWGWALFKANEPAHNVATDFKTDCLTCHIPAKEDDWIYTRGYSILKKQDTTR